MHLFVSYDNSSPDHTPFCHIIYAQVCWKHAIDVELHALNRNHTWTLVSPHGFSLPSQILFVSLTSLYMV